MRLQQRCLYRLAADRAEWGHIVERLSDHPNLPKPVEPPAIEACGLQHQLPTRRVDQKGQKIDGKDGADAKPADLPRMPPDLLKIGLVQDEAEQGNPGKSIDDLKKSQCVVSVSWLRRMRQLPAGPPAPPLLLEACAVVGRRWCRPAFQFNRSDRRTGRAASSRWGFCSTFVLGQQR